MQLARIQVPGYNGGDVKRHGQRFFTCAKLNSELKKVQIDANNVQDLR